MVLNIGVADDKEPATEAILTLFSPHLISSALLHFQPYKTILMISYPGWRAGNHISVRSRTLVELDPPMEEAMQLRRWASKWNRPVNEMIYENCKYIASYEIGLHTC